MLSSGKTFYATFWAFFHKEDWWNLEASEQKKKLFSKPKSKKSFISCSSYLLYNEFLPYCGNDIQFFSREKRAL